jgi:hypothetical protein
MKIQLRDGRTVDVPVNRDDVISITFEDRPMVGGGIAWDFETGDLGGWTPTGDAFAFQPTLGDNPTARHRGQPSNHQGQYWIGGYEKRPRASDPPGHKYREMALRARSPLSISPSPDPISVS